MTLEFRFRKYFRIQDNGCWIWIGGKTKFGYGKFRIGNKNYTAHRVARHIYCRFDLESELNVNHKPDKCNNPSCINPDHTYEGYQNENNRDTVKSGNHYESNKTHCIHGHEYTKENTYINIKGHRSCVICRKNNDNRRVRK